MAEADSDPPTRAVSVPGGPAGPGGSSKSEGQLMGGYRLLDEIAAGGMATVHLSIAESDDELGRFVAIKRMHEHFARDPDFASMFLDEATLCTRIRHENVVATIDVVHEEDELLLVLELVEGESLSKLVKQLTQRKSRVPKHIASAIVSDMLRGLHAAHEATNEAGEALMIVHRDVSPHNVIVGTDGIAKVLDFGVAKARGRVQQTQKGQLKGKLAYMSPEQARGKPVDRRSDLFSAGIVLWELLAGRRLFDGDNEGALLVALLSEKPRRLEVVDPAMGSYAALVHKALETEPDARYQTALEMADAVAAGIPPATRAEVASWVKSEARVALARRDAMISRVRTRAALKAAAQKPAPFKPAAPLPPPSMPRRPPGALPPPTPTPRPAGLTPPVAPAFQPPRSVADEMWDTSTTTQDGPHGSPHSAATPFAGASQRRPSGTERPPSKEPTTTPLSAQPSQVAPAAGPASGQVPTHGPPPAATANPPFALAPTVPAHQLRRDSIPSMGPVPGVPAPGLPQAGSVAAGMRPVGMHPLGPSSGAIPTPASPLSPRYFDRPSDVGEAMTSLVTMTTTDMPPPLPRDQVRRLTMVAAITAGVTVITAVAILVIFTRKPWHPPDASAGKTGPMLVTGGERSVAAVPTPAATATAVPEASGSAAPAPRPPGHPGRP